MNCQQGDKAVIVFSVNPANIGRVVHVSEYISKFERNETFEAYGMPCMAVVHDHYWWIEAEDLDIQLGPSPRAYIADSWLRPLKDPKKKQATVEKTSLDMFI